MKKYLSLIIVCIFAVTLASCSSKEYVDIPVTEIVTDESGESVTNEFGEVEVVEVTDKNGDVVTQKVEKSKTTLQSTTKASAVTGETSNQNNNNNDKKDNNQSTSKASSTTAKNQSTSKAAATSTTKKQTTTKATKPQKRDIDVIVKLPFYNSKETQITLYYKAKGDKKTSSLEPVKAKLDKTNKIQKFTIEDIKGEVSISIVMSGVDITQNTAVVAADEKSVIITPVTGIEIMEDMD